MVDVRRVDLSACETQPIAILLDEHHPRIRHVLIEGVALATSAEQLPVEPEESSRSGLVELAPFVRGELSSKLERIVTIRNRALAWELGAELASARRRVIRSMTALDSAAAEDCGDQPRHNGDEDLDASLRTRKMLSFFRKRVQQLGEPPNETLPGALRTAGIEVARMVCSETFSDLRIHDRVQARQLQQRIMSWLRGDTADMVHLVDGRHLLQDVAAFAALVAAVSQREDLVRHDLQLIREAEKEVERGGVVPPIWHHKLRALEGRNDELDLLLTERGPIDSALLLDALLHVRMTLPGEISG